MHDPKAILALALRNFGAWLYADLDADAAAGELFDLNASRRTVVLFTIADGEARIVAKPNFFTAAEMSDGRLPIPLRAHLYRTAFQAVAADLPGRVLLAIELEDGHFPTARAPLFSFQMPLGSNNVLLPDVDFLQHDYYEADDFEDIVPFAAKEERAIFVGSTTGMVINRLVLDQGLSWRVRAALHFKDHPQVDFRLPNIVMCETPEIEAELRSLGLGGAGGATWREQLGCRYVLSMDGNGATCSRVALALKSHCVLVKYESVHQLYYFPYMQPWLHYVPVTGDRDVEKVLALARAAPDLFEHIGREGRALHERFLTRPRVLDYLRLILTIYCQSGPRFADAHLAAAVPVALADSGPEI